MSTRTNIAAAVNNAWTILGAACLASLCACSSGANQGSGAVATNGDGGAPSSGGATDGAADADAAVAGAIPIVAGGSPAVPYQFGPNPYGITGAAFFAKSNFGSETVTLDTTQMGKICVKGTVAMVPTPADGGHPPYSDWWGFDVGFNLNQGGDASKTPWIVPSNVVGFWFTVEGATIPDIRFKTTPTGKDPSLEQDSCAVVSATSGVPNQEPFVNLYVQCWDGPQGTGPTDISMGLLDVSLQVAADTDSSHDVDFCWTGFGVITD
ncbi:MAG TPA: hypothetical protein VE987_07230 [Polyangiaceae bacterium]|nr:hypothetical protein [Polyangiaceae bacterium]